MNASPGSAKSVREIGDERNHQFVLARLRWRSARSLVVAPAVVSEIEIAASLFIYSRQVKIEAVVRRRADREQVVSGLHLHDVVVAVERKST